MTTIGCAIFGQEEKKFIIILTFIIFGKVKTCAEINLETPKKALSRKENISQFVFLSKSKLLNEMRLMIQKRLQKKSKITLLKWKSFLLLFTMDLNFATHKLEVFFFIWGKDEIVICMKFIGVEKAENERRKVTLFGLNSVFKWKIMFVDLEK